MPGTRFFCLKISPPEAPAGATGTPATTLPGPFKGARK